jgi:hypothetical protein
MCDPAIMQGNSDTEQAGSKPLAELSFSCRRRKDLAENSILRAPSQRLFIINQLFTNLFRRRFDALAGEF